MSKKNIEPINTNEAPRQERGGMFNPFANLGTKLDAQLSAHEQDGTAKTSGASNGTPPTKARNNAPQHGNTPGGAQKNLKSGKQPPAAGEGSDSADAALFMRAVGSQGFKPIKKDTPGKPAKNTRRPSGANAQDELSMAELLAMQERHSNTSHGKALPETLPDINRPSSSGISREFQQGSSVTAATQETWGSKHIPELPERAPAGVQAVAANEEEENLFAQAMQGVAPVDGKGRDLPLEKQEKKPVPEGAPPYLEDFLQGKFEFALEYTDEFFEGHVMGVDPLILAKLRAGQYSPESHVDLHGQNSEQAYESLVTFIRHAYGKGQRSLVVVTGRGKNSPGGLSILRQNMQDWLTKDPLKRVVLAFCTAQPKDGGTGALYVLLRKFKKSSGKIRWDKSGWGGVGVL